MKAVRRIAPKCETCRFFSQDKDIEGHDLETELGAGVCRRRSPRSPQSVSNQKRQFPVVWDNEWCGEWETKRGAS